MYEYAYRVRVVAQNVVGGSAQNYAAATLGEGFDYVALLAIDIVVGDRTVAYHKRASIKAGVKRHQAGEERRRTLIGGFEEVAVHTGGFCRFGEQFLVVIVDLEFLRHQASYFAAAASKLATYGYHKYRFAIICHSVIALLGWLSITK